ncbi:MAG: HD domain-containing protein [Butyrivibrio sp.]|nr:HD domain-containing protein [Butyrivibrio sp.]
MTQRYEEALAFARTAHAGALRKGTDIPYITHPMETAEIAAEMTDDEDVVIAALLHDVVEDTKYTASDIEKRFGRRVAELVLEESEDKRRGESAASTWLVRKQETIAHLRHASREVKLIALADKLSNMRTSAERFCTVGAKMWQSFNMKDEALQGWYYRSIAECTEEFADTPQWREYRALCDAVFGGSAVLGTTE